MRLSRVEVARRTAVARAFFEKTPDASVAKLNAALKDGSLTGNPERMMNIKAAYALRKSVRDSNPTAATA